ncbi:2-oxoadipate dioxygenase/decarboxylase family protein [Mucisphaera sp.]|uniref:2-oxoadipate dioxygenase/decarboxylase family protein n=1 Tax=Mucisphaera sp. TaxID=2913024 RepID=UPI003D135327
MSGVFVDRIEMQNRLFAELSSMFGQEVPLYDKSLLVNLVCNRAVCALLGERYEGLSLSDADIERTSGERHGAIRIGRPDEYRWIGRFFGVFAMEPHNFYDMTALGAKSQPVISTAFRSAVNPEHRVFSSLLMTDYFDAETQARVEKLLSGRQVFSDRAKALIEKSERQGGLDREDADALIAEGTERIFKWMGTARDHGLYKDLCKGGFKIAADVACFNSHHLNHLTPNTFCMDLYTAAMRHALGEHDRAGFVARAERALEQLLVDADRDYLVLHFKHLAKTEIDGFDEKVVAEGAVERIAAALADRLAEADLDLSGLDHSGFKDYTEGPAVGVPVLLRQDAYKALTEAVSFANEDGTTTETEHTARFGEIEQRFYSTTPAGRELYDRCLAKHEKTRAERPNLVKEDYPTYQAAQAEAFSAFPRKLSELLARGLVYGKYEPTAAGLAAAGTLEQTDLMSLAAAGYVRIDGLRYEDFLPFSAAGIFASNLNQYGTASTSTERRTYQQSDLEEILGRPIIDVNVAYRGIEAKSKLDTYERLGLIERLDAAVLAELREAAAGAPEGLDLMAV